MTSLQLPLTQSPEFARSCQVLGIATRPGGMRQNGATTAHWLIQSRQVAWAGKVDLVSRGPVCPDANILPDALARLRHESAARLIVNAPSCDASILRGLGFWPLMTGATLALLDLHSPATMRRGLHQKWRNRLSRAEGAGLHLVLRALDRTPDHWCLAAETAQQRARRYRGWPASFARAFAEANPGHALLFEARLRGDPVAAMVFLRHGAMATYQIGVTSALGRACHAHNWLMWHAMTQLQGLGHTVLDLGTLNTQDAPGLAWFKRGTGARTERLAGSWVFTRALAPVARRLPTSLAA